ncbi:General vesicular transport factor, partial [Paragonimus kellicotti]
TYESHIRRHAIRLLTVLLANQLKETQSVILQCPKAVSKIVDILDDPREALRNDALLLLLELTKSHLNIQKIVAFENTFERLFLIIQLEGLTDGGVVVEDCLHILWQLLDGNTPNQILFKENNFIQRLLPLLELKLKLMIPNRIGLPRTW